MRFDKPRGQRIMYNFIAVEVRGHLYYPEHHVWLPYGTRPEGAWTYGCSGMPCRTYRAFKRFLRKNPDFRGLCKLVNRWVGHDIEA